MAFWKPANIAENLDSLETDCSIQTREPREDSGFFLWTLQRKSLQRGNRTNFSSKRHWTAGRKHGTC